MPRGRKLREDVEQSTLAAAAHEFFRNNKIKGLAQATQDAYVLHVTKFIEWLGEEKAVSDITERTLDDYMFFQEERRIKPISIATIMRHLRRFVNFCVSRNYLEQIEVVIPKYEEEIKEPYTEEEMRRLLVRPTGKNWVEYRNWVMINYFFSTGHRLSSVLNIKVEHIDFINKKVKLIWNKDKRPKYMPLSTALCKILKEYIDRSVLEQEDYLFPEYEGGQLKKRSAEDSIADYNKSRNVSKTSIHLFRHTFAKTYILNGGNPLMLQKLLNHKTIDMTLKYVNLYGNEISKDLDIFNPLDTFNKNSHTQLNRRKLA